MPTLEGWGVDEYMAVVDTLILLLLVGWSFMDRCNLYFRNKD